MHLVLCRQEFIGWSLQLFRIYRRRARPVERRERGGRGGLGQSCQRIGKSQTLEDEIGVVRRT